MTNLRKATVMLITVMVLAVSAGAFAQAQTQPSQPKRFKMAGTVQSVDTKEHKVVVQHGDIPGFMGAMTMPYNAGKQEDLTKVSAGDQIQADVVVSDSEAHLENIKVIGHAKPKDKQ